MQVIKQDQVQEKIITIRDRKVIIDADVAELYGVETKRVNEAVKNNPDKFPEGYLFELTKKEWDSLKSKFSTSIKGGKIKLPSAFTERGLYLKGIETTYEMNFAIFKIKRTIKKGK